MDKQFRISFLINPISGGGQGKTVHQHLPEVMESMGFTRSQWQAEFTDPKQGDEQIFRVLRQSQKVVTVGGDGTMSSVMHCIAAHGDENVEIGLVPLGTGNDVARTLNIYDAYVNRGLLFLVRELVEAPSVIFDLWQVCREDKTADQYGEGNHILAAYFSAGLDARVAEQFNRDRAEGRVNAHTAMGNKLHYGRCFFGSRQHKLETGSRIEFLDQNDKWVKLQLGGYRSVVIGNIPSFASGGNIFLESHYDDGLLEIVPVPTIGAFAGTYMMDAVWPMLGRMFKRSSLPSYHAREIRLYPGKEEFFQLDGEGVTDEYRGAPIHITHKTRVRLCTVKV